MTHTSLQTLGLLGGTFDPIHFGHLRLALELQVGQALHQVHFIPCYSPVHRGAPHANPETRLRLIKAAIADHPRFIADDREIKRQGPSYTIDTLKELRHEFSNSALCLMLGMDAFLGLTTWKGYEGLFDYAHVIVAHRPQFTLPSDGPLADLLAARLQNKNSYIHEHLAGGIVLQAITPLEISASSIRKQIANGDDPRYLLPDAVYQDIMKENTYRTTKTD